jgi:NTP pyrophosphatase (non-canonical NTP hydrolase)
MQKEQLYSLAIDFWGQDAQIDMCVEEASELIQAICKYKRANGPQKVEAAILHIAEEVADVEIMLEQLKLMLGIEEQVNIEKDFKMTRLEDRLSKE